MLFIIFFLSGTPTSGGSARARAGANQALLGNLNPQPRTEQLIAQDNGAAFARLRRLRIENIKAVTARKQQSAAGHAAAGRQQGTNTASGNSKHALVFQDFGINYDMPLKPEEVAQRRAERIAKEKQKQQSTLIQQQQFQQQQQQQQHNPPQVQQALQQSVQQQSTVQQQQVKTQEGIKYLQQKPDGTSVAVKQQSISLANAPIIIQQTGTAGGTVVVSQQQLQQAAAGGGVLVASGLRAQRIGKMIIILVSLIYFS